MSALRRLAVWAVVFACLLIGPPLKAAVGFSQVSALAANATTTTLAIVTNASGWSTDDLLVACVVNKDNQTVTAPGAQGSMGAWTVFAESNNTANQRITIAWARATGADANGDTFNFTKPTDNNLLYAGAIIQYTGVLTSADPLDATAESVSNNASSDTVTYADFNPTETSAFVVACGVYNNDLTTAGAMSGTDPTFTNRADLETATGSDASLFFYDGSSSGAATGSRTHSTTSTLDDVNIGVLFGLIAAPPPTGPRVGSLLLLGVGR